MVSDPVITRFARDGREFVVVPADMFDALMARAAMAPDAMPDDVRTAIDGGTTALAAWRRYRGMSQTTLARAAGVSQVWISRIENGDGHGTAAARRRIAAALGIGIAVLGP